MGETVFQPGERCAEHEIVRLVGAGGFAQVYEARSPSGARVALKALATSVEARPKLRARLAQEGAALSMICHPHVVRLLGSGFHGDHVFLLLELVEGRNLRLAARTQGVATIVRWLREAAEGVAEAHRQGIVHRDLKPENLLVTREGLLKVIDFGIAKLSSLGVRTSAEQRLGTALYMAPEQIQGAATDPRMDVYALGLVLYEALTGVHPIITGAASVFEVCACQLHRVPRPFAEAAPWAPPALAELVDRAVEKDPARRLPSMRALADGLAEVLPALRALDAAGPPADGDTPEIPTPASGTWLGPTAPIPSSPPRDGDGTTAPIPRTGAITFGAQPLGELPRRAPAPRSRAARALAMLVGAAVGVLAGVWITGWVEAALRR
jgi:serine/threonine-protein kinase